MAEDFYEAKAKLIYKKLPKIYQAMIDVSKELPEILHFYLDNPSEVGEDEDFAGVVSGIMGDRCRFIMFDAIKKSLGE